MILAQSGESYPINRNGVDATINKSVDDIMAYVTNLGYNSFLLVNATYGISSQYYVILPFDATLVNGDSIYLLDNPTGVSVDPTTGARADRVRNNKYNVNNDGNIQQDGSVSWSSGTYYGATYRTYPYRTYEPVFYTTLEYSKIYVNNEDVTPVLYTWKHVPSISGSLGVLSLSAIKDENIGDGNTIYGQPLEYIKTLAPGSRIETIATNLTKNEQKTIIYSGNFYRMDILRSVVSWPTTGGYVDISTAILKFYLNPTTGGVDNLILAYSVPFGVDANGNQVMANYLGIIIDDEQEVAALAIIRPGDSDVAYNFPGAGNMTAEEMHNLWIWVKAGWSGEDEEPIDSFEDNDGNGGGDLINRPHNPIPEPGVPGLSAYDTGFVSQYIIGKTALKSLASFLWSASFVENVQKFFNDPRQIIQGIVISDVLPGDTTANVLIKAGGISTGVYGAKVNKQFERYDMGKLTIDKRLKTNDEKGGIYFDYSPYTRLKLYLPY